MFIKFFVSISVSILRERKKSLIDTSSSVRDEQFDESANQSAFNTPVTNRRSRAPTIDLRSPPSDKRIIVSQWRFEIVNKMALLTYFPIFTKVYLLIMRNARRKLENSPTNSKLTKTKDAITLQNIKDNLLYITFASIAVFGGYLRYMHNE
jgi:hypothetical protein